MDFSNPLAEKLSKGENLEKEHNGRTLLAEFLQNNFSIKQYDTKVDKIGIDAYFEIQNKEYAIDNKRYDYPVGILFAGQIKTGDSYFSIDSCSTQVDTKTVLIWQNLGITVFLFVIDSNERRIYWLDTQEYVAKHPVKQQSSYTFTFLKNGHELTLDSKEELFNIVLTRFGKVKSPIQRAVVRYKTFLGLAQIYEEEKKINDLTSPALLEADIREWFSQNGNEVGNEAVIVTIINVIKYYITGIGVLGILIEDKEVRAIDVFETGLVIIRKEDEREDDNIGDYYDFKKLVMFFSQGQPPSNHYIITLYNGEMSILLKDLVVSGVIHIAKKQEDISISDCVRKGFIEKSCIDDLYNLIQAKKNILLIGTKNCNIYEIASGICSLFNRADSAVLVEDRPKIAITSCNCINLDRSKVTKDEIEDAIREAKVLKKDRIIFNIGHLTGENILPIVLKVFLSRKGCLTIYNRNSEYLRRDFEEKLVALIERDNSVDRETALGLTKGIDCIIQADFDESTRKGYISKIRLNEAQGWSTIWNRDNVFP